MEATVEQHTRLLDTVNGQFGAKEICFIVFFYTFPVRISYHSGLNTEWNVIYSR